MNIDVLRQVASEHPYPLLFATVSGAHLYSPLLVLATPEFEELKRMARGCITRRHVRHYIRFARNQWALFEKGSPRRVKPLLYVYRVLLTGIHLMRTGEVEANLVQLNEVFLLPYVPELVACKLAGAEQQVLADADLDIHRAEFERLLATLEEAGAASALQDLPVSGPALHELVVGVGMNFVRA